MMNNNHINRSNIFKISSCIVITDQLLKHIIYSFLGEEKVINLIPNLIRLNIVKNTGAAFSLFSNSVYFLGFMSLIISIILIFWVIKKSPIYFANGIAIAFILGGSIGNGIDRWFLGYVIDFIELIPINFPIFNIADIAINIACIILIIDNLKQFNYKN